MSNCLVSLFRGLIGVLESRCRLTSQHANLLTLNLFFYDLPNLRKWQSHMDCGGRGDKDKTTLALDGCPSLPAVPSSPPLPPCHHCQQMTGFNFGIYRNLTAATSWLQAGSKLPHLSTGLSSTGLLPFTSDFL